MKTNLKIKQTKKRKNNPFLAISIVILIVVAAMAFSALDIFVLSEDAPVAEATIYTGTNAKITHIGAATIALGGKRNLSSSSSQVTYSASLTFTDLAGAAYRNGAVWVRSNVNFDTTTHNDFGGMSIYGDNLSTRSTSWGSGDTNRSLGDYKPTAVSGKAREYKVYMSFWADDSGTYWVPFKNVPYATDTDITPTVTVGLNADTAVPTSTITSGNTSTWATSKTVYLTITDNLSGVNPATIRVNGAVPIGYTENGRSVTGVQGVVTSAGSNNLAVSYADYFGNATTKYYTVNNIDTAPPYVVSQMERDTSSWTNQNVILTATVRDTQSGIKTFTMANSIENYAVGSTGFCKRSVSVASNGTYTANAYDHVGKSVKLNNITVSNIDKTKPVINNIYFDPKWTNENVILYIRATDSGGSGLKEVRRTAPRIDSEADPKSGTINGFTYTHTEILAAVHGKRDYTITAYDNAGNASTPVTISPNIDCTAPTISSPTITGKLYNGTLINAASAYSYSNITVTVPCSDSGGSGIASMKINGVTQNIGDATSFTFDDIITKNTIVQSSYDIELRDRAGNTTTITIEPKKDSTTPDIKAIGNFDWQNVNQMIQASVWTGLSGGEVQIRRTYLGDTTGAVIQYKETENFANYGAGTNMYDGANKVYRTLSHTVATEGEEYYHFKVVSGTGVETPWKGLNGANATEATIARSGNNWTFASNGARTRIDRTAPEVVLVNYTGENGEINKSQFSDGNNFLAESFIGHYKINDGIKTSGGNRSDGVNGSGLAAGLSECMTYTIDFGLTATSQQIFQSTDYNHTFNSFRTKSLFDIVFSNQGLSYNGEVRVPTYTITVKDRAGNTTTFTEKPYIDDKTPSLEMVSAKTIENANVQLDYDYTQEQNWTRRSIIFTFKKTFGQSGATIKWYIDENKGSSFPVDNSPSWQSIGEDASYGTLLDSPESTTATLTLPTASFDATIFFKVYSKAKDSKGKPITGELPMKQVGVVYTHPYIAVDNDKPVIDRYEFNDNITNKLIGKNDWSGSDVYLNVYTDDGAGSGVKNVTVTISGTQSVIPMTKQSANHWRSTNLLDKKKYKIEIEDNVGNLNDNTGINQQKYITFEPQIDTEVPKIEVTETGGYGSEKGGYGTGSYIEAIPTTGAVTMGVSSVGNPIKSGAELYYMRRSVEDFIATRYSVNNEPGKAMINWNMDSELWTKLYTVSTDSRFISVPLSVGASPDSVEHFGYDFLIKSNAGHMVHYEYGTVFVDSQLPKLIIEDIIYIRDDGLEATGIIPANPDDLGKWTNAAVTAKLYVTDEEGSGVAEVRLKYQKDNIDYDIAPTSTEDLDIYGNGFYLFKLDSYIDYTVYYRDNAGNESGNENKYKIKPLIDRQAPTILLNASYESDELDNQGKKIIEIYRMNAESSNGVVYINKNIKIDISLTFGVSSFAHNETSFEKGNENYSLWYSHNNKLDMYNITEKMGDNTTWTNPADGSKFDFVLHTSTAGSYTMTLTEDQDTSYYFEIRNGVSDANKSGNEDAPQTFANPRDSKNIPYNPKIKIDKTAPTIKEMTFKDSDKQAINIDEWTNKIIYVSFKLFDNDAGSGVLHDIENTGDDRKSVMLVKRETDENQTIIEKIQLNKANDLYEFEMDGYFNYYIEFEDNIGNGKRTIKDKILAGKVGGIYGPIKPLIDTFVPTFEKDAEQMATAESNGIKYDGNWTNNDITLKVKTTVGISGQRLQYSMKTSDSSPWGPWTDVDGAGVFNGVVEEFSGKVTKETTKIFSANAETGVYRFRVLSIAQLKAESNLVLAQDAQFEFGWIRIDKVVPTIAVVAKSDSKDYVQNTWTRDNVNFTLKVTRGASGSTIEVTTNIQDTNSWGGGSGAIGILNNATATEATLSVMQTTNTPVQYYFRVRSNAGNITDYFRAGDVEGSDTIAGFGYVKIDKVTPKVICDVVKVKELDLVYGGGTLNYGESWSKGSAYTLGKWTSDFVMLRIKSTVGPSGGKVYYSDENSTEPELPIYKDTKGKANGAQYDGIDIYNKAVTTGGEFVSYMLITENQNRNYRIKVESNTNNVAVNNLSDNNGNIMIDQRVPYMKISVAPNANKSIKWLVNDVNDLHKWYTSAVALEFHVGWYVKKVENSKPIYEFEYGYPVSGATVFYRTVGTTNWISSGISNNAESASTKPQLVINSNVGAVQTFEFKIVSGAGKEFYITEEYSDSNNLVVDENLWTKSLTGDNMGEYTIKVDTTDYTVDLEQWIKGYQKESDVEGVTYKALNSISTFDMAKLVVEVNGITKSSQKVAQATRYTAKRGDNVTISIDANAYDSYEGYGYIFKRVAFTGGELNQNQDEYITSNYVLEGVNGEMFSVDMFGLNYNMKAYFTKEINIVYSNLIQHKQTDAIKAAGITSTVENLTFTINYEGYSFYPEYKEYTKSTVLPLNVGQYSLIVSLENDNIADPSYKIYNPDGEELLIKYYYENESTEEPPGTEVYPVYLINNVEDMKYIGIYNDPNSRYDALGEYRTDAIYEQTMNIEISKTYTPIYGTFSGTYDGKGFKIHSVEEIEAEGMFGIFESVSGNIMNLGIWLHLLKITNATNAGFLAGSSASGAIILNCYAIGEMFVSGSAVNVGGLVGHIYDGTNTESNYTDIAMSNKGEALSGDVGGMFGLVEDSTMRFNYAIGAIEAYGVDELELRIGTFAGCILSTMEDDDLSNDNEYFYSNKYLEGNLFVNEEITDNGGKGYIASTVYTNGIIELEGLNFNSIISSNYGALALNRINELGMDISQSNGTADAPFNVDSTAGLAFIDKYVWAHYVQASDIVLEADYNFATIAAHKVFTGSYNGQSRGYVDGVSTDIYRKITNVTMISTDKNTGMFGKVAGTIKNVDIRNLNVNIKYMGNEDAYAGGIVAILLPGARLQMVIVQGNIVASAPNARLRIGGIAGIADGATLLDTLSLANVKTENTYSVDIGGTVGSITDSTIRKIFSLGRVEGKYTATGSVGAIAGTLLGTTSSLMSDYYAIVGNTYAHGQSYDYLVGYAPGATMDRDTKNTNFMTFEQFRNTSQLRFDTDNSREIDIMLYDVYGFEGQGTEASPFLIHTVEDFALINNYLYASYRIRNNLNFVNGFTTIGYGAKFTGSLDASMTTDEYINEHNNTGSRNFELVGLTDALVYHNAGTIKDLRVDIRYNKIKNEDTTFGAIAIYNSGTIQGVTAEGHIILKVTGGRTAIVGGFVGEDLGGEYISFSVDPVVTGQEPSKELSSITGIMLSITASQINAGGFVGRVSGPTLLSYVISNGDIICVGGSVSAGTIAGAILNAGVVYDNEIETAATVEINGVDTTKEYGFNIMD